MRLSYFIPGLIFLIIAIALFVGLSLKPREIPSALIDKPAPEFDLPAIEGMEGGKGFSTANLKDGQVSLVNIWASWCGPCRMEHPYLMDLQADGIVPIYGINQKDKPANAMKFLDLLGDPYDRIGADITGRTTIDWGVYGVPETFVVRGDGTIAYKHVGPITPTVLEDELLPAIKAAKAGG